MKSVTTAGRCARVIIACGLVLAAAGCDDSTPVGVAGRATGVLQVSVSTSGADIPTNGYTVSVDSGAGQPAPVNGKSSLAGLNAGGHSVTLYGLATNCTLNGVNTRAVEVIAGDTVVVAFSVGCIATSAGTGTIRISTTTTGVDLDPDGYRVSVDGGAGAVVGVNYALVVPGLNSGSHTVTLGGTAFNCAVSSANPRSVEVVAGGTADVSFAITCTTPALTGQFAFMRPLDGKQQIYVMHGDGSSPTRVSDGLADDRDPAWSPHRMIAFTSDRDGNAEVYVMHADGSGLSRLTNNPAADFAAAWSPDGRRIAFTSNRDGYVALYVMNADGTQQTKVAGDSLWTWVATAWSPDGARLAFTLARRHGCCDTSWVSIVDADGTNLRTVYTQPAVSEFGSPPNWSPDGARIVFSSYGYVMMVNTDGTGLRELNTETVDSDHPVWSPDGTKIAFAGTFCGFGAGEFCDGWPGDPRYASVNAIYVLNADGSGLGRITDNSTSSYSPAWRP